MEIVTDDFVVNCYKAIEQYLLGTRSPNLPLDMLPMIYENTVKQKFPVPLSIIARGFLEHLFVVTAPATGVLFVEVVRLQNTSRQGILAAHKDRFLRLRDAMAPKPAEIADEKVAKSVQLILRGLHRAIELNPIPAALKSADLDSYFYNIFFKVWNVPLLLDGSGFSSVAALIEAFPRVVSVDRSTGRPTPLPSPDFAVGKVRYVQKGSEPEPEKKQNSTAPIRNLTPEQAQLIDNIKGSMALLKVELLECGRDRDKYNMLSGKLSVKHKQLEELMSSFNTKTSV